MTAAPSWNAALLAAPGAEIGAAGGSGLFVATVNEQAFTTKSNAPYPLTAFFHVGDASKNGNAYSVIANFYKLQYVDPSTQTLILELTQTRKPAVGDPGEIDPQGYTADGRFAFFTDGEHLRAVALTPGATPTSFGTCAPVSTTGVDDRASELVVSHPVRPMAAALSAAAVIAIRRARIGSPFVARSRRAWRPDVCVP